MPPLTSGDVVRIDLGTPIGSEAGMVRPAVVVTAQRILHGGPKVVHVVPLTTTLRGWISEIEVEATARTGLSAPSAAQAQHVRAVSIERVLGHEGNVGPVLLAQVRETIAVLLDL